MLPVIGHTVFSFIDLAKSCTTSWIVTSFDGPFLIDSFAKRKSQYSN